MIKSETSVEASHQTRKKQFHPKGIRRRIHAWIDIHHIFTKEADILFDITSNWKLIFLRGVLAVAFGLMALGWPGITLGILVLLFGIYAILEGAVAVAAALEYRSRGYWWLLLIEGIAGIAIGLCALIWPTLTVAVLLVFIVLWAIVTGIFEIGAAIQIRKEVTGEWVLAVAGILSVLIGILLIANLEAGAVAVVWLIGLYALVFGALLVFLGFRLRRYQLV